MGLPGVLVPIGDGVRDGNEVDLALPGQRIGLKDHNDPRLIVLRSADANRSLLSFRKHWGGRSGTRV